MKPTGIITIRSSRVSDGKYYVRRRLNFVRNREHLDVTLRPRDVLVVQFDVLSFRENAGS